MKNNVKALTILQYVQPWYLVILTINRYWLVKNVQKIHDDGLMAQWNVVAFHLEVNQDKKTFLEPVALNFNFVS